MSEELKQELKIAEKPETVDMPEEARGALMGLIVEEAMKSPVVQSYIKGVALGIGLKGKFFLRYDDFKFVKEG